LGNQYIYIDESGDLGLSGKSSHVLILSALITDDPNQLDRIIKNARRHKFKKELRNAKEIKFNKSSKELKEYFIKKLNQTKGCQVIHCILFKDKLYSLYLKENKHKLYNFVSGHIAKEIIIESESVEIRVDESKGKQFLRDDFNRYFEHRLRTGSNIGKISIIHSHSENFAGIQLVDIISGSAFQKYNNGDSHFVDMIDQSKFPQKFLKIFK
jgi:hypothetical protein